jgi:hypothetical protein
MPPLYVWVDEESGKRIEILRPFDGYLDPPTAEEATAEGVNPETAKWKKLLGTGIQMTRGPNWGGSKGNW